MNIKEEQTFKFINEIKKLFFQGGCGSNDLKILIFLLTHYDEYFSQVEIVKRNSENRWTAPSVSKSVKKLLAYNLLVQTVVNTTVKYKINLDWKFGDTYKEENF